MIMFKSQDDHVAMVSNLVLSPSRGTQSSRYGGYRKNGRCSVLKGEHIGVEHGSSTLGVKIFVRNRLDKSRHSHSHINLIGQRHQTAERFGNSYQATIPFNSTIPMMI